MVPPWGIRKSIAPGGGVFPLLASQASLSPSAVLAKDPVPNHRSFRDAGVFDKPPGHDVMEGT